MAQESFDRDLYQAALAGYEQSKSDIEKKIAELRNLLQGARKAAQTASTPARGRRRRLSRAARQRIAEAQKQRWARFRQQKAQARGGAGGATKSGSRG
jgi:hypothetical protein